MSAEAKLAAMLCPACHARYEEGGAFCSRDGTPLVRDPQAGKADLVGQVLADRYRVVRLIGEGGMGQVYEAHHVNINKRFALKLLRPEIVANAEAVARFRQEAWSASSIGHDNIIEMEDFATLPSGAVYLAMELLEGEALSDRMRHAPPLTLAEALDICLQVASGLGAAHDKSIVHRDMKPENIFLTQRHGHAVVKILDFGIAKVSGADGNKSLTRTGTIFGTPHYMSPEQALGRPLDHRADVYSVGVIMYELFAGRVPFEAESFMGILTKHITCNPTPPRALAPDLPELLEAVILRAMAKEADERYQTMAELAGDLYAVTEAHAPEVLAPRTSQLHGVVPRPPSLAMAAARLTPGAGARPPSGLTPLSAAVGGAPVPTLQAAAERPPVEARWGAGRWLAIGGVALAATAAALLLVTRKAPAPRPTPLSASVSAAAAVPVPAVHEPALPAAPVLEEVIVDSLPPGAKIFVGGAAIAEAPDTIQVERGASKTVVLKKDGFTDQTVTLDPAKSRKLLVRLERVERAKKAAPPSARPAKPPAAPAPPTRVSEPPPAKPPLAAPPSPPAAPLKKKVVDPYERVDEPKKGSDVLNPY